MTVEEREKRAERAVAESLVTVRSGEGFTVYAPAAPEHRYVVTGDAASPHCTCQDYLHHEVDPGWRCKHIIAAFDLARSGSGQATATGKRNGTQSGGTDDSDPARLLLRRSVSPDGRIDSLSVEISLGTENGSKGELPERAAEVLKIQDRIVERFLHGEGETKATPDPDGGEQAPEGAPATLIEIGGMDGKWGRRLYITVRAADKNIRLFGSREQLAKAIAAAGFPFPANGVKEGVHLDLPCRVTTKPAKNEKYVDVEKVLPAGTNGTGRAS